jgi:two-component system nitrate/nitrite response regulator NarL
MGCQLLQTAFRQHDQRIEIVASAVSRQEIIEAFTRSSIDVALINESLGEGRFMGLRALQDLHASYPKLRVVMLFHSLQDDLVLHAFRAGAKGVFCRSEPFESLCKCIEVVHQGQVWVNSSQLQLLLGALGEAAPIRAVDARGLSLLAKREAQVVGLVVDGLTNREVALKLGLSEHTVSNYLFRIYNKLGISSRVELVLYVMRQREG